jgi:hypothetical protein
MILKSDDLTLDSKELWNALVNDDDTVSITASAGASEASVVESALKFSSTISREYTYIKWNLGHFDETEADAKADFDKMLDEDGLTEDMITPINRYMNFSKITGVFSESEGTVGNISPDNLELNSGYKVWVSNGDVTVGDDEKDYSKSLTSAGTSATTTIIRGIIIAKGDVRFNSKVTRFEGLIVAGGKIYIGGNLKNIVASPEICRSIIKECMTVSDDQYSLARAGVCSLFKQYNTDNNKCPSCGEELKKVDVEGSDDAKKLECPHECADCQVTPCAFNMSSDVLLVDVSNIDYPDVCSIDNWTKTVE